MEYLADSCSPQADHSCSAVPFFPASPSVSRLVLSATSARGGHSSVLNGRPPPREPARLASHLLLCHAQALPCWSRLVPVESGHISMFSGGFSAPLSLDNGKPLPATVLDFIPSASSTCLCFVVCNLFDPLGLFRDSAHCQGRPSCFPCCSVPA